ncbi:MAG: extracellular solute-binding protein [Catenulispora sp.]|nr:extracellular solute-binding protein [Catenulispora sp.]
MVNKNLVNAELGRRGFLWGGAGVAALTLTGCGSTAGSTAKASSAAEVTLPAFVPLTGGAAPDLPATSAGVPAAYYTYPAAPVAAYAAPPLSGGKISAMTPLFTSPPSGHDANPSWQAVEKALGAKVDITMIVGDDYDTKLSTTVAGDSLPDLVVITADPANLPGLLTAKFADLTPLLGGDKAKQYPHLAAIPTAVWEQCTSAGKLSFIPIPRNISAGSGFYRQDMFAAAGVNDCRDIKSADDFLALLKQITIPGKQYGVAGSSGNGGFSAMPFLHIFGVPNMWRLDGGGNLTAHYETDEYKAAVEFMAEVYKAGCYLPGSQGWTKNQMEDAFQSGKAALIYDGLPGFGVAYQQAKKINPAAAPAPVVPFGHAGGKGVTWKDNIYFARVALKKADPARLAEVLKACDFFASPFGTKEHLLLNFGVEGTDYTLDQNHNPVLTAQGKNDTLVTFKYLSAPTQAQFYPGQKDLTDLMYKSYTDEIALAVADPTASLYSPTAGKKGTALGKAMSDAVAQIITGQSSLSALDSAVKTWRSNGGDQIRSEYLEALHGGSASGTPTP